MLFEEIHKAKKEIQVLRGKVRNLVGHDAFQHVARSVAMEAKPGSGQLFSSYTQVLHIRCSFYKIQNGFQHDCSFGTKVVRQISRCKQVFVNFFLKFTENFMKYLVTVVNVFSFL